MDRKLSVRAELILGKLKQLHGKLKRKTLLNRYAVSERPLIVVVVEQLNDQQLALAQQLLNGLESPQLTETEIDEMWAVLAERLPELPPAQAEVADWAKTPELDTRHRLKVTLPIVPLLVDYEAELELNSGLGFQGIWKAVKEKLQRPKPPEEPERQERDNFSDSEQDHSEQSNTPVFPHLPLPRDRGLKWTTVLLISSSSIFFIGVVFSRGFQLLDELKPIEKRFACNKVSNDITVMTFAENGKSLVTGDSDGNIKQLETVSMCNQSSKPVLL